MTRIFRVPSCVSAGLFLCLACDGGTPGQRAALASDGASDSGWIHTTHPTLRDAEVFTVVPHDTRQLFVTKALTEEVWRHDHRGWTEIATTHSGDPALIAVDDAVYVTGGANSGATYNPDRPMQRLAGLDGEASETGLRHVGEARNRMHESLWAFDEAGEGRVAGNSTGLPPVLRAQLDPELLLATLIPTSLLQASSFPFRIDNDQADHAVSMGVRNDCLWPTPVASTELGVFRWGCISSTFAGRASYDIVLERPGGDDVRTMIADEVRAWPGGLRHLLMDAGRGLPFPNLQMGFPRPSLAYSPAADTYLAMVSELDQNALTWRWANRLYASRDGGETWTDEGALCAGMGRDCFGGSVVFDAAAKQFSITWHQRGQMPYEQAHAVRHGWLDDLLSGPAAEKLLTTAETIDVVAWEGLAPGEQYFTTHDAHGCFVAIGYWKNDVTTYGYKQFPARDDGSCSEGF